MKLGKRIIRRLIKIVKKFSNSLVDETKIITIDKLLEKAQPERGKQREYDRQVLFRLVCDAWNAGKRSASEIARYANEPLARLKYWITKSPSHDTISDFFNELVILIDDIFELIVKKAKHIGLFKTYVPKLIDTTDIKTRFKSDPNAQWNKDTSKDCWYWGYGGLLVIDAENHLPCAARLIQSKRVNTYASMEVLGKSIEMIGMDVAIGDSEFDMKTLINYADEHNVLFITRYNPRRSKQQILVTYRNQLTHDFDFRWLDRIYKNRVEIEHSIGTVKENLGLEELYVKGYEKVKVQFLLTLCLRLLQGIVTFQRGLNPRRVTLI